jgi:hypothetical protein
MSYRHASDTLRLFRTLYMYNNVYRTISIHVVKPQEEVVIKHLVPMEPSVLQTERLEQDTGNAQL